MGLLLGVLTFILVVDCLLLILLILIQLPKKEAGIGTAFGGSATDALFGAGSGTALTKITRYAATVFLVLAMGLSVMHGHRARQSGRALDPEEIARRARAAAQQTGPAVPTNLLQNLVPLTASKAAAVTTSAGAATNVPAPAVPALQTPPPAVPAPAEPAEAPEKK
ncbi:MAG: preprotein translocase subunit SecG [Pedosphaera parvula]|nr:preprotein translocase subunit SecG [Pedosphaera parvula]